MDNQICYNKGSNKIFICSNCGAIVIGVMIDDFDCAIEYTKAARYCSNCKAKIIRTKLIKVVLSFLYFSAFYL